MSYSRPNKFVAQNCKFYFTKIKFLPKILPGVYTLTKRPQNPIFRLLNYIINVCCLSLLKCKQNKQN